MELWELLVPTTRPNGRPIRTRFHRVWDRMVRQITGGLTILQPVRGQWISPSGELFVERMIPVRIACSEDQINQIIDFSIKYYDQEAVMAYRISDRCIIRHKKDKDGKEK